ncbi:hypothetical protein [Blastococcus deserti]|uniref:CHAD domain-containing protein n=1 Tax=Blastococcus deserti TaxID=2259033 RepID=A0ABW4X503_9ACTN
MQSDAGPADAAEQIAARARRQTRLLVTAGRLREAREELLRAEQLLVARAAETRGQRARRVVNRALRDVRGQLGLLDQATGRAPLSAAVGPKRTRPAWEARLGEAATLIGWGQVALARAALDAAADQLAEQDLPAFHPTRLRLARLYEQLEPPPRHDGPTPAATRSSSVRTVSGGLPTLGRRR